MPNDHTISRRGLFMKLGILFNGLVATALAVPILRYLLSSVTRARARRSCSATLAPFTPQRMPIA